MSDEILLSESNLERVWMDADWNVRIELTDAGHGRHASTPPTLQRRWPAAVGGGLVVGVGTLLWRVFG